MKLWITILVALHAVVSPAAAGPRAIPPEAVAVVFNSNDAESKALAEHYREARGIPAGHLIGLPLPNGGTINRTVYDSRLRDPLIARFSEQGWWKRSRDADGLMVPARNKIRILVCVRGVPWRIQRSPVPPPETEDGRPTKFRPVPLQDESAVDSELAMLGVDAYDTRGPLRNPYFQKDAGILEASMDAILLVARLDGPTAGDARRLVDDAIATERHGLWGMTYLDIAKKGKAYKLGDDWIEAIATRNADAGIPTVVDRNRDTFVTNYPMAKAALYFGWYAPHRNGPLLDQTFRFKRGAIAVHLHSFSAADLHAANRHWVGPIIAHGAAATLGNTWEPYLHITHHFDIFHDRLLKGYSLAEAAYMAAPALSWQGLVIGDPLYRPFAQFSPDDAGSGPDREFKLLRMAALSRGDEAASRRTKIRSEAARAKSGLLYEALGLAFLGDDRPDVAAASFESARRHYDAPADKLRQDLHLAEVARHAGRKDDAIAHLRRVESQYREIPGAKAITGVLNILDPPAPPPVDPAKIDAEAQDAEDPTAPVNGGP
ncbi:MAG: TIGR03790 family protein [Akkermansiaceae bacterium]|nr:TIGR03790 family protein [Akkermansiaceae bacterium]NNM28072.1 TIGR03790 family protein [Akkermansiaceae bacterium]